TQKSYSAASVEDGTPDSIQQLLHEDLGQFALVAHHYQPIVQINLARRILRCKFGRQRRIDRFQHPDNPVFNWKVATVVSDQAVTFFPQSALAARTGKDRIRISESGRLVGFDCWLQNWIRFAE